MSYDKIFLCIAIPLACAGLGVLDLQTEITEDMIDYYTKHPIHCNCTQKYSDLTYGFTYIPCISGQCTMPPNGSCETLQVFNGGYGARCSHHKIEGETCEVVITTIGVANKCSCDDEDFCNSKFATTKPNITEEEFDEDDGTLAPPLSEEDLASAFFNDGEINVGEKDTFHEDMIKMYMDKEMEWKNRQGSEDEHDIWFTFILIMACIVAAFLVGVLVIGLCACYHNKAIMARNESEESTTRGSTEHRRNRRTNRTRIRSTNADNEPIVTLIKERPIEADHEDSVAITIEPTTSSLGMDQRTSLATSSAEQVINIPQDNEHGILWSQRKETSKPEKKVRYNSTSNSVKIDS